MNHPNETLSISTPSSSAGAEWPKDAVPQAWVEELFRKLSSYFGSRLADMWRGTDVEAVKREWGMALVKLSRAEWKAGVSGLISLKHAPTLPEFYGLCKQMRLQEMPRAEALTDQTRADPNVVAENMARIRSIIAPLMKPKEPTAEWAYKLLMRGESRSGKSYPYGVVKCATDAITSSAGRLVIENCIDADLKAEYAAIRESVIEGYRAKGMKLWETP